MHDWRNIQSGEWIIRVLVCIGIELVITFIIYTFAFILH